MNIDRVIELAERLQIIPINEIPAFLQGTEFTQEEAMMIREKIAAGRKRRRDQICVFEAILGIYNLRWWRLQNLLESAAGLKEK